MAARSPQPPTLIIKKQLKNNIDKIPTEQLINNDITQQHKCLKLPRTSDCCCTNISIRHLFLEMKQEFPTVPDHIVNQCVIDNCHDRENCIKCLQNELALHPTTAQAYPSHLLRNNQTSNNILNGGRNHSCSSGPGNNNADKRIPLRPTRPAPTPQRTALGTVEKNPSNGDTFLQSPTPHSPIKSMQRKTNYSNAGNFGSHQQQSMQLPSQNSINHPNEAIELREPSQNPPQRPKTLNFREPFQQSAGARHNQINRHIVHKPVRKAPPPPLGAKVYTSIQSNDQNFSSTTSIQSPLSFSDSGESEISVNFSLSPSSDRTNSKRIIGHQHNQIVPVPQSSRRISSITLQPAPPYSRDHILENPRSYTSLNVTLRRPSSKPQSPIDITAGPGLSYSSVSFDARLGYQTNFQITVTDEGGMFSASRIRPKSCVVPSIQHQEQEFLDNEPTKVLRLASSDDNILGSLDNSERHFIEQQQQLLQSNACLLVISRQKLQKMNLEKAIQEKKQVLKQVQYEIKILNMSEYPGLSEKLDDEINRLRCECQIVLNKIDAINKLDHSVNDDSVHNQHHTTALSRPPIPPPISRPPLASRHHQHQQGQQQQPLHIPSEEYVENIEEINSSSVDEDGPQWSCKYCTFLNDPLMIRCEKCDNNRDISGTYENHNLLTTITT